MRRALHARVHLLVERFKSKLLDLAAARVDSEITRIDQALEVALSAYESDGEPDLITAALGPEIAAMLDTPPRKATADDWLALMNAPGKGRGLRQPGRPRDAKHCVRHDNYFIGTCWKCESIVSDAEPDVRGGGFLPSPRLPVPEPAVAAEQGSTIFTGGAVNPPALVDLEESPKFRIGHTHTAPFLPKTNRRRDVTAPTADGKSPPRCSKCGYVGGRSTGCGTSHPTQALPPARTPSAYETAKARVDRTPVVVTVPPPPVRALKPTAAAIVQHRNRLDVLRERSAQQQATDKPIARAGEDDNPNAEERWTKEEIDDEKSSAEARKLAGELPGPVSTWVF